MPARPLNDGQPARLPKNAAKSTQTRAFTRASVAARDEARCVLDRLRRIEELKERGVPARVLLEEVRALLGEAEAWIEAEGPAERAAQALESSREALAVEAAPISR